MLPPTKFGIMRANRTKNTNFFHGASTDPVNQPFTVESWLLAERLDLTVRTENLLKSAGIYTSTELYEFGNVRRILDFGPKSYKELNDKLTAKGFKTV